MLKSATRQLLYTLNRSPEPEAWVVEIGIRIIDGGVIDDKMSCEIHEFRSAAAAALWLREKARELGVTSLPEQIGPTSVPLPLGSATPV